ncbi:GDP-mannose 4,6-dehydratase [Mesorhizobium sp. BR115XR7A]|uniref:GDP-mannose 4,6-dehydratase n=1 Tax=Mesorhizobium sp. BR115XR7A TaxID=2876645 RepID=UPI001CCB6DB9|nr:GDP-mannose 4,6-dehydratase [Mesorhizobium sp. BR115XR7A]MBZ9909336.1 GDP-mannose 4,6-dehydratase [Mesorhizobium sp. BR115XR7A]MBZ9932616.1 GDP-mannose 4,6-dehydratase [Mesorhizobium sp. BR1-1-5]
MRRALVTGCSGQDGWYLAKLLASKGYAVHGHSRRGLDLPDAAAVYEGDLSDHHLLDDIIDAARPDEIYNLCSLSRPQMSWDKPLESGLVNALMPHHLFDRIRQRLPECRVFQATSSEIFGDATEYPQSESTVPMPQTPYGIAKLYAHQMTGAYRQHYGLYVCSGILFNHESPRRPLGFVSQKIAYAAACLRLGIHTSEAVDERGSPIVKNGMLYLGNMDVHRDFGFAGDYVEAMWLMLQQSEPRDYVIGTGESHSIREFCEVAFALVGLDWKTHVAVAPDLVRAVDSRRTIADSSRARAELNWRPRTSFEELVRQMVEAQIASLQTASATRDATL